ncbi:MAG: DUF4280 domain-containing protein [Tannerella sp.]|jgi:hypothetical protein|nr:DUF4280 domain-containing protein [Tannerella sp.]
MANYVCSGAQLKCAMGLAPSVLIVTHPAEPVFIENMNMATIMDFLPVTNIQPFGMCRSPINPAVIAATAAALGTPTPAPCIPATGTPWVQGETTKVMVKGKPALMNDAKLSCMWAPAGIEVATTGQSLGIAGTGAAAAPAVVIPPSPRCLVLFRPDDDYQGEFGFDWLRDDIPNDNVFNMSYERTLRAAYLASGVELRDRFAYNVLKSNEYNLIWNPIKGSASSGSYLNLFPETLIETLSIYPEQPPLQSSATLQVYVEINNEDVDEIKFEFDGNFISINGGDAYSLPEKKQCSLQKSANSTIKITCKNVISNDNQGKIEVWAYPKGSKAKPEEQQKKERKLVGLIKVGPNNDIKRLKIVLVKVLTNIDNISEGERTGTFVDEEIKHVYLALYQALIIPEIEHCGIMLDLSKNKDFQVSGKYVYTNKLNKLFIKNCFRSELIHDLLKETRKIFLKDDRNKKYRSDWFTAFSFDNEASNEEGVLSGSAEELGMWNIGLFRNDLDVVPFAVPWTLPHEILHSFGLFHTHDKGWPEAKYIYDLGPAATATDNVMSYNNVQRSTWKWQWIIMRRHYRLTSNITK